MHFCVCITGKCLTSHNVKMEYFVATEWQNGVLSGVYFDYEVWATENFDCAQQYILHREHHNYGYKILFSEYWMIWKCLQNKTEKRNVCQKWMKRSSAVIIMMRMCVQILLFVANNNEFHDLFLFQKHILMLNEIVLKI